MQDLHNQKAAGTDVLQRELRFETKFASGIYTKCPIWFG